MSPAALVTGATGNVGSAVVRELLSRSVRVRAFVRDPARVAGLGPDVEVAQGDFTDVDSLRRAMQGTDRLLLSSADSPDKVAHETAVIEAAEDAGIERIVRASTALAEPGSALPPLDWNGRLDRRLASSPVRSLSLHSAFYMTNLLAYADAIRAGKLFAPVDGARVAMVDPRDVGRVAAVLLLADELPTQPLPTLTGPAAVTFAEAAAAIAAAVGRPVEFVDVPDEAALRQLESSGAPPWLVTHLSRLFPIMREGTMAETTDAVVSLTGREPRTIARFATDHAAAFGG
jgi:uncharacterized protein YbjT (DUF2867 family)